jgi:uncharacterized protein YciI
LIYSRAVAGVAAGDAARALVEEHWSYMDGFADRMVARGPTLAPDRATWTGSLHIIDLPGAEAAHEFVEREPYHRAGLFEQHLIRRFDNLLGRTMWEFPGAHGDPRFLVIAQPTVEAGEPVPAVPASALAALGADHLIVYGQLLRPDEARPDEARPGGVALALQAPTRQALDTLLGAGHDRLEEHFDIQIHDWEFGGRR